MRISAVNQQWAPLPLNRNPRTEVRFWVYNSCYPQFSTSLLTKRDILSIWRFANSRSISTLSHCFCHTAKDMNARSVRDKCTYQDREQRKPSTMRPPPPWRSCHPIEWSPVARLFWLWMDDRRGTRLGLNKDEWLVHDWLVYRSHVNVSNLVVLFTMWHSTMENWGGWFKCGWNFMCWVCSVVWILLLHNTKEEFEEETGC